MAINSASTHRCIVAVHFAAATTAPRSYGQHGANFLELRTGGFAVATTKIEQAKPPTIRLAKIFSARSSSSSYRIAFKLL
jgi:hypothetical protein